MRESFRKFSVASANAMGAPWAFVAATATVLVWAASGPVFGFSDTWQLVINTGTTVLTFLAVFLIQNTQNRDSLAIHLKLDELLRGVEGARTGLVSLEVLPDEKLAELDDEFQQIQAEEQQAEEKLERKAADGSSENRRGALGRQPSGGTHHQRGGATKSR